MKDGKKIAVLLLSFSMAFLLFPFNSIAADYNETITARFQDTTYSNGKSTIHLKVSFPRTEDANRLYLGFTISFSSENGDALSSQQVYLNSEGLTFSTTSNNPGRKVYLYGQDGLVKNDADENLKSAYWQIGMTSSPGYSLVTGVYQACSDDEVDFTIPLSIANEITDNIIVSGTVKSCYVCPNDAEEAVTHIEEKVSFVQGTITPGNSSSSSTELEVGEGKDITNSTNATVTGTVENGTATLNVADIDKACVVAYTTDNGATYTRMSAEAGENDSHNFTVQNYNDSMQFVVAVKGDVSGDGDITSADWGTLVEAFNGSTLNSLENLIGDVSGDGDITSADWGTLVEAFNGSTLSWNN